MQSYFLMKISSNSESKVEKTDEYIEFETVQPKLEPENEGQQHDWDTWCPGVSIGNIIDSPLNPILFE